MNGSVRDCIERWRINRLDGDFTERSKEDVINFLLVDLLDDAKTNGVSEEDLRGVLGDDLRGWVKKQYEGC
jgi:hypothetical protein